MKKPDLNKLLDMLVTRRPAKGEGEATFVKEHLLTLPGAWQDTFGNVHVQVGRNPSTLFSSHTDTVHKKEGKQKLLVDPHRREIFVRDTDSNCLGADDGAGVFLMCHMIANKVGGYYVFHREEECGGRGSDWIANNMGDILKKRFKRAIAFDRKDVSHIVYEQSRGEGASLKFANALAAALNKTNGKFKYEPNNGGTFTDVANYFEYIPECVNISVGYYDQHTKEECLDIDHVLALATSLCTINWDSLPTIRDASKFKEFDYTKSYGAWGGYGGLTTHQPYKPAATLVSPSSTTKSNYVPKRAGYYADITDEDAEMFVAMYPHLAAQYIAEFSTAGELEDMILQEQLNEAYEEQEETANDDLALARSIAGH